MYSKKTWMLLSLLLLLLLLLSVFYAYQNDKNIKPYFCLASCSFLVIPCCSYWQHIDQVSVGPFLANFFWAYTYLCTRWISYIYTQYDMNDVTSPVRYLSRRSRLDIRIIFINLIYNIVKVFPLQRLGQRGHACVPTLSPAFWGFFFFFIISF